MANPTFATLTTAVIIGSAGKIIKSLGVGIVTYGGLSYIQNQFIRHMLNAWDNIPADAVQIMLIGGIGEALNWVLGAVAFSVSYKSMSKFGVVLKGS